MFSKPNSAIKKKKKLLALINEFSKVAGYKVNVQKSGVFLHTRKEQSEKKTIPFIIVSKIIYTYGYI